MYLLVEMLVRLPLIVTSSVTLLLHSRFCYKIRVIIGDVAQLGERRVRNAKVGSSILLVSTTDYKGYYIPTL